LPATKARPFILAGFFVSDVGAGLDGYDEPEILPSSTRQFCLSGADPRQLCRIDTSASGAAVRSLQRTLGARLAHRPIAPLRLTNNPVGVALKRAFH